MHTHTLVALVSSLVTGSCRIAETPVPGGPQGLEPNAPRARAELDAPRADETNCRVTGRVIDEAGTPCSGVLVRLQAYRTWARGVPVPRLPGPYEFFGFDMHTGSDGSFAFEVPPPSVARVRLLVILDAFHSIVLLDFGSRRHAELPPLLTGRTHLGDLKLAATGVVSGRVTDRAGAPVVDAICSAGSSEADAFGPYARSGLDGTFRIDRVSPGPRRVRVSKEGWLPRIRRVVEVVAGRVTEGAEFVLTENPFEIGPAHDL